MQSLKKRMHTITSSCFEHTHKHKLKHLNTHLFSRQMIKEVKSLVMGLYNFQQKIQSSRPNATYLSTERCSSVIALRMTQRFQSAVCILKLRCRGWCRSFSSIMRRSCCQTKRSTPQRVLFSPLASFPSLC